MSTGDFSKKNASASVQLKKTTGVLVKVLELIRVDSNGMNQQNN